MTGLTLVGGRTKSFFFHRAVDMDKKTNKGQHHFPPLPHEYPMTPAVAYSTKLALPPSRLNFFSDFFFLSFWSGLVFHPPYSPLPTTNCIDGRFLLLSVSHFPYSLSLFLYTIRFCLPLYMGSLTDFFFLFVFLDIKLSVPPPFAFLCLYLRTATPLLN
jgi:hypothetical protein